MDQEIHPSEQGWIDSVKINPSLLKMREYTVIQYILLQYSIQPLIVPLKCTILHQSELDTVQ